MTIGKLKKLELRQIWKNEATDFTCWLEDNVDALSETLNIELFEVRREELVGPFRADLVAVDEHGNRVVIENQLGATDHKHLGQILTYVSNLDSKTVIWICSVPQQEHVNAVNWLNIHTPVNFYLLQIEAVAIDDSKPAPLFQIICQPDEKIRSATASLAEPNERGQFNLEFWTLMTKKCESRLPGFARRKPSHRDNHRIASGIGGIGFVFLLRASYHGIELYIDTEDADTNESILQQLQDSRKEIEHDFGKPLFFDSIPDARACRIRYLISEDEDVMNLDKDAVLEEMITHMIKFEKALKPRLKNLNFDDKDAA
jgi:hypothetical protein